MWTCKWRDATRSSLCHSDADPDDWPREIEVSRSPSSLVDLANRARNLEVINRAFHTHAHGNELNTWLQAFANAQLSIRRSRLSTGEFPTKRRTIQDLPSDERDILGPNNREGPVRCFHCEVQGDNSNSCQCWYALLDAVGLELQDHTIPDASLQEMDLWKTHTFLSVNHTCHTIQRFA